MDKIEPALSAEEMHYASNLRIATALEVAESYGQTDGAHHKAWVIDQMVLALTSRDYGDWVARAILRTGGSSWDTGIAP